MKKIIISILIILSFINIDKVYADDYKIVFDYYDFYFETFDNTSVVNMDIKFKIISTKEEYINTNINKKGVTVIDTNIDHDIYNDNYRFKVEPDIEYYFKYRTSCSTNCSAIVIPFIYRSLDNPDGYQKEAYYGSYSFSFRDNRRIIDNSILTTDYSDYYHISIKDGMTLGESFEDNHTMVRTSITADGSKKLYGNDSVTLHGKKNNNIDNGQLSIILYSLTLIIPIILTIIIMSLLDSYKNGTSKLDSKTIIGICNVLIYLGFISISIASIITIFFYVLFIKEVYFKRLDTRKGTKVFLFIHMMVLTGAIMNPISYIILFYDIKKLGDFYNGEY